MIASTVTDLEPQLANFREYWLGWGQEASADDSLTYYRSGVANGQLNGVLRLQKSDEIDISVARAKSCLAGMPWLWWVGPDSERSVADKLIAQGAERIGTVPIMAVPLDRVAEVAGPPDLKIETVESSDSLVEWVRTYCPSFGIEPELLDLAVRVEAGRSDSSRVVRFIARIGQEAVGTALMREAHGVAGIYVVSTAASRRRQGIGALLTSAALDAGRQRGLRIGSLQSSQLGAPVYARMGFEKVSEYQLLHIS
ncbi:GNAT family N-acetyltransferase [Streptomyces cadmiisoli]|uniref:GNAT family N-acetyltransferase n=1 Tax=Streptomyces cadmiisoli TaxID=2184053 RepID=UPI003D7319E0